MIESRIKELLEEIRETLETRETENRKMTQQMIEAVQGELIDLLTDLPIDHPIPLPSNEATTYKIKSITKTSTTAKPIETEKTLREYILELRRNITEYLNLTYKH